MYQVKITREIKPNKTVLIFPGEPLLNEDGTETGRLNEEQKNVETLVKKTAAEVLAEENVVKQEKIDELQPKIDSYEAAKANQLANGGPGPVADFDVMKICNEHDGNFEVVFKED